MESLGHPIVREVRSGENSMNDEQDGRTDDGEGIHPSGAAGSASHFHEHHLYLELD